MRFKNDIHEIATIDRMSQYGGGFVKALAECYRRADFSNKALLRNTFGHYFTKYSKPMGEEPGKSEMCKCVRECLSMDSENVKCKNL